MQKCPEQYPKGVKLMCYENDDPSKPVRIEVVGSRWRKDTLMGKQAIYVVIRDGEYEATEFTTAHEEEPEIGWSVGWDCPPPSGDMSD
jgi:hypothetical protein